MFCASRRCGLDVDPSMCIVRCFVLPPWRWVGEAEICWLVFATHLLWRNWQYVDFFFCRAFGDHEADDMLSRFCRLKNLGYVDILCRYGNILTGLHHSFADREICRLAYASCRESLPTFLLLSHVCWWMVVRYRTYRLSLRRFKKKNKTLKPWHRPCVTWQANFVNKKADDLLLSWSQSNVGSAQTPQFTPVLRRSDRKSQLWWDYKWIKLDGATTD